MMLLLFHRSVAQLIFIALAYIEHLIGLPE